MRRRRAGVVVLLAGVLAGLLTACVNEPVPQPSEPVPTAQPDPTKLVVAVGDIPAGFNPHLLAHLSPVTTALATLVLPSVFRPDADGAMQIDQTIATSAEVVATEPFTVSYELNLEASWSDNAPIAAEDFVYLWERMREEPGVADDAGYRLITDVRSRAGGKAVDVVFAHAYPAWKELFTDLLPAHLLKDAPGSWVGATTGGLPASGGPFRIGTIDRDRGLVELTRNDLYWDAPSVLDVLVLQRLDDAQTVAGLASGDVDIALTEADADIRTALGGLQPAPHTQPAPQPVVVQLGMRGDGGPLADPRARQGVAALVDREAVRARAAPDALPADAFGLAPSEPGYQATAPQGAPARPDPVVAGQLLAQAGWSRDLTTGRWAVAGAPVRLVLGAAAERPDDLRVARIVAEQLDQAGIDVDIVAPGAVALFGQEAVPATPPSPPPTTPPAPTPSTAPGGPSGVATPAAPTPEPSTAPPSSSTTSANPTAPGTVEPDLMVLPRTTGGDPGTELASDYGCPSPSAAVPFPPRPPTGFCFAALQPALDDLVSPTPRADAALQVERVLWQQLPALPLFQPVTLVISTSAADAATGVGPGPLRTGPVTGAQEWRPPNG
ncbi:ABC transporter substrate-binding protein [Pseudonocardia humida]|uniref:ABC transporter substrate-binding protein n=1 Tax=Pseudonocardia humida TaxID=2800819 RepID=A0ABT1A3J3_9PSEU|nr:ABC transporter substrate-binding protein [Pseudonocardia humida]MCO1657572.1 ABC transporter substrate-binding protein [Pseudonocardia humida]